MWYKNENFMSIMLYVEIDLCCFLAQRRNRIFMGDDMQPCTHKQCFLMSLWMDILPGIHFELSILQSSLHLKGFFFCQVCCTLGYSHFNKVLWVKMLFRYERLQTSDTDFKYLALCDFFFLHFLSFLGEIFLAGEGWLHHWSQCFAHLSNYSNCGPLHL